MDQIQRISMVLGFVAMSACSAALVRKHVGVVAADGSVDISDNFVDSTHPLVLNRKHNLEIDFVGNIKNFEDEWENGLLKYVVVDGTARLPLASSRPHANQDRWHNESHLALEASAGVQTLSEVRHVGDLDATVRHAVWQHQPWPSGLLFPAAQSSNHEGVGDPRSILAINQSSNAVDHTRRQHPLMELLLLTTAFVCVGFIFAALFPDRRCSIVDGMNAFTRSLSKDPIVPESVRQQKANDFLSKFEVGEKLGEGAFGVVHVVRSRRDGKQYAAKMIDVMGSALDLIKEEVAILKRVQHASLTACCLYEYHDQCFYYLVMPFYSGGDLSGILSDYIETEGLLPERLFSRVFEQMAKGVAFLHSKQVVHRDIKPENFLLASPRLSDPKNRIVVADFGMSTVLDDGAFLDEVCGTPIFMSPELFEGKYEFKVDVFALGLSAYVLLTGSFAFNTEKEIMTWATSSDAPPIPPSISRDAQEIVEKSLARDASQRLTAKQLEKLATRLRARSFVEEAIMKRESLNARLKGKQQKSLRIAGGNLQEIKGQRRHRMLCELIRAHEGKIMDMYAGGANISAEVLAAKPFEMRKGRRNRMVSRFEFWSREKCLKNHVSGIKDEEMEPLAQVAEAMSSEVQLLEDVLARYNVNRSKWGQGEAKSIADLARECRGGVCFLTESEEGLERVVEIVAIIVNHEGKILHQFPLIPKAALGKASQRRANAFQTSSSFMQPRLPATKMEPWETVHDATDRVLGMLSISEQNVDLAFDVPMRVVKETSTSYPGLTTVYKMHRVEAWIRENNCSSQKQMPCGLPGWKKFVTQTEKGALNWGWVSLEDAEQMGTLHEGEEDLAMRYAEVLPVKSKVITGDRIKELLEETNSKVGDMSHDALEELAEQIRTGEVELVEEEQPDGTRIMKRKVTVTMLRLVHQTGNILLEVSRSTDRGATWKQKNYLPGKKQHTFENPYYVARSMISSRFMVTEGRWRMDKDAGGCIIEERESDELLGLPTIYMKNVVAARLC